MRKRLVTVIVLCGVAASAAAFAWASQPVSRIARYEYIVGVGRLSVYDIATRSLIRRFALPGVAEIRGIGASAATGMLYVSYGGFPTGIGHLLKFSLYRRKVVYDRGYRFGIDSFDISHDGRLIFMPTGENTSGNTWHVLAATTGRVVRAIAAGRSPHDTAVGASGRHVFLGGASDRYLYEADAARPWKVTGRMGPLEPGGVGGVRPFTIDAQDTLAFTTANRYLGFQVSDVATGRVLYTVPVPGFSVPATFRGLPSHGIGLSPSQRDLWLVDNPNRAVHEFDISGLPHRPPVMIATVHVSGPNLGWLNLSRDGRYLFAGGAGNVISTQTRTTVGRMARWSTRATTSRSTGPAGACARRTYVNRWATCTSRRSAAPRRAEPPGSAPWAPAADSARPSRSGMVALWAHR